MYPKDLVSNRNISNILEEAPLCATNWNLASRRRAEFIAHEVGDISIARGASPSFGNKKYGTRETGDRKRCNTLMLCFLSPLRGSDILFQFTELRTQTLGHVWVKSPPLPDKLELGPRVRSA